MKATVYKSLSDSAELRLVEENQPLYKAFSDIDFDNAIALVNGKKVSADYILKRGDNVAIRILPAVATSTIMAAAIVAAITVAVVAVGAVVGYAIYKKRAAAAHLENDLDKVKRQTNNDSIDNRPFVAGATNSVATNKTQPYICGRSLFTPYLLGKPWYTLEGEDGVNQYTYEALELGFNKQVISLIKCDDILMKTFSDTEPQEGAGDWDAGIFSHGGRYEIAQDGNEFSELEVLNSRVFSQTLQKAIPYASDVQSGSKDYLSFTLDSYATYTEFAVTFPNGLFYTNDDGYRQGTSCTVTFQYSVDNGNSWTTFATPSYSGKKEVEARYVFSHTFTYEDYVNLNENKGSSIIVRCCLNAEKSNRHTNSCYVLFVQSKCFDPNKSSKPAGILDDNGATGLAPCKLVEDRERQYCCMLGIRIMATDSTEEKLKKVNVITTGTARVWDGTEWSEEKSPTRNPAAWLLEVLTSPTHPLSQMSDTEIDLESIGDLYEYCEENDFYFDYCVTQKATKKDLVDKILDICGAAIYKNIYGKYSVAIDKKKENAVACFTAQNILSLPEHKKEFSRRTDAVRVKYINSAGDLYKDDTYLVYRTGITSLTVDSVVKDVTVNGITTFEHVVKYARRIMALEALRPKTTTIKVGKEGIYYTPLSKVLLQDDGLKVGLGNGYIKQVIVDYNTNIITLILSCIVHFETGKNYGLTVNHITLTGSVPVSVKVMQGDSLDTVIVSGSMRSDSLAAGDCFAWGELDESGSFTKITTPYLITSISQSDKGTTLELTNYDDAVYETGEIPEYKSNITQPPANVPGMIPPDYVTQKDLYEQLMALQGGNVLVGPPDVPTGLVVKAYKDGIQVSCNTLTPGLQNTLKQIKWTIKRSDGTVFTYSSPSFTGQYNFDRLTDGYPEANELAQWTVSAVAQSIYGKDSEASPAIAVDTSMYGTWELQQPAVSVRVSDRTISLLISQPQRADGKEVYGTLTHGIKIRRPDLDSLFYLPATSENPYPETIADKFYGNENNYKVNDTTKCLYAYENYIQTLPLKGQATDNIVDTLYQYQIIATNESGYKSDPTIVNATALCTSIRDLVKSNETAKEAYISQLSALSANVGTITQGAFGNNNNIWDLSTFRDDKGFQHYEGLFHVGGGSQYLHVDPVLVNGQPTGEYTISFKVGAFEISADASNINGELIIQYNDKSLDRTRITQTGTFYEHRETVDSTWKEIASDTVNGVKTQQVFSEHNLVVTNQSVTERRLAGTDIGNPYLSENAKVYHFDENFNDQKGESELLINGSVVLVGNESSGVIDFTPAILAISPYSTVCKSAYGQFSAVMELAASNIWTVDFWTQYIYAENQILFDIGNDFDKIKMTVQAAEAFYNDLNSPATTEDDNFFYSYETSESQLYTKLLPETLFYNEDVLLYNERDAREPFYNRKSVKEWSDNYIYFRENQNGLFVPVDVSVWEYDDLVSQELLYEEDCVYNEIEEAQSYISHEGINGKESVSLKDLGIDLKDNMWLHVGIISSEENLTVYMDHISKTFGKYSFSSIKNTIILNAGETSFILDELYIDNGIAESYEVFCEHTQNRIPWGALDKNNQHFILEYNQNSRLITNIFDSDLFKNKVLELINTNK